jgi:Gas vesicle protein K/Gas vesicle protein
MRSQNSETRDQILKNQQVTLLELLDRLLDKGVVVKGEILLSVADVDLVYLNLGLLLSSVKTIENAASRGSHRETELISRQTSSQQDAMGSPKDPHGEAELIPRQTSSRGEFLDELQLEAGEKDLASTPLPKENSQSRNDSGKTIARTLSSAVDNGRNQFLEPKTNIDQKNIEKGLTKLVLTLVELIRKLMEKQAIRRIEDGQLSVGEIENVGNAFLLLDEKMEQLKKMFDLTDEELNLDLGPLGELM